MRSSPQATKAHQALSWCRHGLNGMLQDPVGDDWVLLWAGTITLLRAVGHALHKEDTQADQALEKAVSSWWRALKDGKPQPAIFWDFIERDRNLLLKEATLTVGQSAFVRVAGAQVTAFAGRDTAPPSKCTPAGPSVTVTYHMNSGPYQGWEPRVLVDRAIAWWDAELAGIETDAKRLASGPA